MPLEALHYVEEGQKARFRLLDQRELPLHTTYIDIAGAEAAWKAIKARQNFTSGLKCPWHCISRFCCVLISMQSQDMAVRGAPAIAIAGALALAAELQNEGAGEQFSTAQEALKQIKDKLAYLVTRLDFHDT